MSENGADFKLYIQNATGDDWVLIAGQNDGTFNPGKTLEGSVTKDGTTPYFQPDVTMFECEIDLQNPPHASHSRAIDIYESGVTVNIKVEGAAGGLAFSGKGKISVQGYNSPVQGIHKGTVKVVFQDSATRGVAPVAYPT